MPTSAEIDLLQRLVESAAETLGSANPRLLKEAPFRRFARHYNKLRGEAVRLLPNMLGLMPPAVPVGRKAESGDG